MHTTHVRGCIGAPSFVDLGGGLALFGVRCGNDGAREGSQAPAGVASYDDFVPHYMEEINALMSGESLTVLPEPATWILCGLGLAGRWASFAEGGPGDRRGSLPPLAVRRPPGLRGRMVES